MEDKVIECSDCGVEFILSVGGQEFFESKGWPFPKRCRDCRAARKAARGEETSYSEERSARYEEPVVNPYFPDPQGAPPRWSDEQGTKNRRYRRSRRYE